MIVDKPPFPGASGEQPERRQLLPYTKGKDGNFYTAVSVTVPSYKGGMVPVVEIDSSANQTGGCQISLETIKIMGDGDEEAGLMLIADALTQLDESEMIPGRSHPIYKHAVFPAFGGEEAYYDWAFASS